MAEATDYLYNDAGTLRIENGDFVIGPSDEQHMEDIVLASPGEFRQYPTLGVGITKYLKGSSVQLDRIVTEIKANLELDGYKDIRVQVNPSDLTDIDIKARR